MTLKKAIGKIHLWLGLASGLLVLFLGITGCILAFQREIETVTVPAQYVTPQQKDFIPPSEIHRIAAAALPDKHAHSVIYGEKDKAVVVVFYQEEPEYYYLVYVNPYTGVIQRVKNMDEDFFRIIVDGHFYLWLPPEIGKPIVATGTLVFVVMMISGIVLWWPRNKAARKQRFSIKWNAKWRRVNYDLHNVFGFYMSWVAIFIGITGLVWGFQWFADGLYWLTSGGEQQTAFYMPVTTPQKIASETPAVDAVYQKMTTLYPNAELIEVHIPDNDSTTIEGAANPDAATYWQTDYRYFDQYTLEEVPVTHIYGKLEDTKFAGKLARMNYDIHVGAVLGLPGKILAFFASLLAASLPVTGFCIWWGRRNKERSKPGKLAAQKTAVLHKTKEEAILESY